MLNMKLANAIIAIGILAGCNTNNSGQMAGAPPRDPNVNKPLLETLQTRNQAFSFTDMADLPRSGSANYTGFAQIFADGAVIPTTSQEVVGVANLTVGFSGSGSMTGSVTNFDDVAGVYDGTLTVTGGSISAGTNGPKVRSAIAGTLTRNTGEVFEVSGNLTGGFNGPKGEYLNGADKVTVTSGGRSVETDITLNAEQ